jgi:hypothetical protein
VKLKDYEIVGKLQVTVRSALFGDTYRQCKQHQDPANINWIDWSELSTHVQAELAKIGGHNTLKFTAVVVKYKLCSSKPKRGLDRIRALSILRRMGILEPTSVQVAALANRCIITREMLRICQENENRRIVCPVPINKEHPTYFYFGPGQDGKGSFRSVDYNKIDHEKRLYFWKHGYAHDQGDEVFVDQNELRLHFPLILGIVPENVCAK